MDSARVRISDPARSCGGCESSISRGIWALYWTCISVLPPPVGPDQPPNQSAKNVFSLRCPIFRLRGGVSTWITGSHPNTEVKQVGTSNVDVKIRLQSEGAQKARKSVGRSVEPIFQNLFYSLFLTVRSFRQRATRCIRSVKKKKSAGPEHRATRGGHYLRIQEFKKIQKNLGICTQKFIVDTPSGAAAKA